MATEKYSPYKGIFNGSATIEATLEWFNSTAELIFLWIFPDGTSV